jgi:crossover junction endodeoxyribonuclease RuvC
MRIIGIDPGSTATGYGVVDKVGRDVVHVAHGVLRPPPGRSLAARLAHIHRGLAALIAEHRPDAAAVEEVFLAANPRSALVLGQARGVVLAAIGDAALPMQELAAREVKKAIVGTGRATKGQVQEMVVRMLSLQALPPTDAADGLAIAITHASAGRLHQLGVRTGRRQSGRRTLRSVAESKGGSTV